ncbi:MAG TPA: hypothetical protein VFA81_05655 [Burkholderiales bacterium]|nr:hypothetical protein [Burkholderiales bacterium]
MSIRRTLLRTCSVVAVSLGAVNANAALDVSEFLCCIARIVALYFVSAHRADWFAPLHEHYIPTLLILACGLFFLAWTARADSWAPPTVGAAALKLSTGG